MTYTYDTTVEPEEQTYVDMFRKDIQRIEQNIYEFWDLSFGITEQFQINKRTFL